MSTDGIPADPRGANEPDATASEGEAVVDPRASVRPPPRSRRRGLWEWLWRSQALADAERRVEASLDAALVQQAREHVELADRLTEQTDVLRSGSGLGTAILLYREALVLVAAASRGSDSGGDGERVTGLLGAEADPQATKAAEALLVASGAATSRLGERELVAQAHAARALLRPIMAGADAKLRPRARALRERKTRTAVFAALLVGLSTCAVVFVPPLLRPRNLLEHATRRPSSVYSGFSPTDGSTRIFFHTNEEKDPFIEFDMGKVQTLRHFEITNRGDCCQERAVPLIIQTSVDGAHFAEVARRDKIFETFDVDVRPVRARFVKLFVHKKTWFHLEGVAAW